MHLFGSSNWWAQNGALFVLSLVVFIEWVALQALVLHYHFFRKSLKRPTPDGIRFAIIEKTIAFQSEQTDTVFRKLAEIRKEVLSIGASDRRNSDNRPQLPSFETSMVSMGEMQLKKRIQEIKTS